LAARHFPAFKKLAMHQKWGDPDGTMVTRDESKTGRERDRGAHLRRTPGAQEPRRTLVSEESFVEQYLRSSLDMVLDLELRWKGQIVSFPPFVMPWLAVHTDRDIGMQGNNHEWEDRSTGDQLREKVLLGRRTC
jgi:hypothetical protein